MKSSLRAKLLYSVLTSRSRSRSKGFTLIEVLTVLVIISVIAVIGIPTSVNVLSRNRLTDGQTKVLRSLKTAQSNARRFGEDWEVSVYETGNRTYVAVYPKILADDSPGFAIGPTSNDFYSTCNSSKRTCFVEAIDPLVRVDTASGSPPPTTFLACDGWASATTFCRRAELNSNGTATTGTYTLRLRNDTTVTNYVQECVTISSTLGVIRLDC